MLHHMQPVAVGNPPTAMLTAFCPTGVPADAAADRESLQRWLGLPAGAQPAAILLFCRDDDTASLALPHAHGMLARLQRAFPDAVVTGAVTFEEAPLLLLPLCCCCAVHQGAARRAPCVLRRQCDPQGGALPQLLASYSRG